VFGKSVKIIMPGTTISEVIKRDDQTILVNYLRVCPWFGSSHRLSLAVDSQRCAVTQGAPSEFVFKTAETASGAFPALTNYLSDKSMAHRFHKYNSLRRRSSVSMSDSDWDELLLLAEQTYVFRATISLSLSLSLARSLAQWFNTQPHRWHHYLHDRTYKKGDIVLGTGQISRKIYSLSEGDCVVIKDDVQIGHIGKSELFGEIAFILGCSSTATVQVASEEATVLAFDREALEHKLSESTELAAGFFQYLARMLRNRLVASETEAASKFGL
jgi:hypothetical protein